MFPFRLLYMTTCHLAFLMVPGRVICNRKRGTMLPFRMLYMTYSLTCLMTMVSVFSSS